jgi:alpha-N-arabinofuranosidase
MAIQPVVNGPAYDSPSYGRVNYLDASAILGDGVLHAFLINRSLSELAEVEIDAGGNTIASVLSAEVVKGSHPKDCNTYEHPRSITSQPLQTAAITDGKAIVQLPPLSFAAVTFNVSW